MAYSQRLLCRGWPLDLYARVSKGGLYSKIAPLASVEV
jgi:hypothetical protein